jgi:hypothetical protein
MRKDSVTLLRRFSAVLPHMDASVRESWCVLIVMADRTRTLECQVLTESATRMLLAVSNALSACFTIFFPLLSSSVNHGIWV